MASSRIIKIDLPLDEDKERKWKPYFLYKAKSRILEPLKCHVSVLSAGHSPHAPHAHAQEEILIVLDGEADLVISDSETEDNARIEKATPGTFVYYPAWQYHTIRNSGDLPVTYLMFKWVNPEYNEDPASVIQLFDTSGLFPDSDRAFATNRLLDIETRYLDKLHCHLTSLKPGGGYKAHADEYDVAIVTLGGNIKTLGQTIDPYSVVYFPAGKKHGMKNESDMTAYYIVFEFHSSRYIPIKRRVINRIKRLLH
ncbi:MAG: cupin domain-containing protein [Gammaproteobacteria bacterium]|nr:cupin domain-containing protein [Gammaproteobacteria bacterium]